MGVDHPKNFRNSDSGERARREMTPGLTDLGEGIDRERGVQGDSLSEC